MKILLVHNFYGSSAPSGENAVFLAERELLRQHGHEVIEFTRHSDEIREQGLRGLVRGTMSVPWNPFMKSRLRGLIVREQPDVMHVHNTFPLLSPSVFHAAAGVRTAAVFTLHNYRIFCPGAVLMKNGAICTECIDRKSVSRALKYGCYRSSRAATLPLALSVAVHRWLGTWQNEVDAFITLTDFQRNVVLRAGLAAERVFVKPNFYPDPPSPEAWQDRENKAVFVGRLGAEKGVRFLVEAWKNWGAAAPKLEVIGDGPEKQKLEKQAFGGNIVFMGQLPFSKTQGRMAKAKMLVLPSVCYEGFPMVVREAFALGVPVAASRIGALPHIVDDTRNGILFEPGNAGDLLQAVQEAWKDGVLEAMAKSARGKFDQEYTAGENYKILIRIYESAMSRRRAD